VAGSCCHIRLLLQKKNQIIFKTNEHGSRQANLQDQSQPSTAIGSARLEPRQHQSSLPSTASASLLQPPLNSGLSKVSDGDENVDNDNGKENKEDANDMDATILTQYPEDGEHKAVEDHLIQYAWF
jgi:hypothetical protein